MIADIYKENIILEDDHVLLRSLVKEDYQYLLPFAIKEPDIWKYSLVSAAGEEGMKKYIESSDENILQKKEYVFIVFDKKTKEYAGSTRFYDIQPAFKTTLLGYTWYGQKFQRTGLNRHCKFLLLQFAFEQWGLERVEFRADPDNERSVAAMKAIGCIPEGILRNHMPTASGKRRNTIILSILKEEWFSTGKTLLKNKMK